MNNEHMICKDTDREMETVNIIREIERLREVLDYECIEPGNYESAYEISRYMDDLINEYLVSTKKI